MATLEIRTGHAASALAITRWLVGLSLLAALGGASVSCGGGGQSCLDACAQRCRDEAKNNCPPGRVCFCDSTPCFKACGIG